MLPNTTPAISDESGQINQVLVDNVEGSVTISLDLTTFKVYAEPDGSLMIQVKAKNGSTLPIVTEQVDEQTVSVKQVRK